MKNYKILAGCILLALTTSCGASKIDADTTINPERNQNQETVANAEMNSTTPESDTRSSNTNAINTANGTTGGNANIYAGVSETGYDSNDYDEIYESLNMTSDQIRTFEIAMKEFREKKRNSANGEMMGTLENEKERQLKNILTEDQLTLYENYQK